jgi:hypothetical protein
MLKSFDDDKSQSSQPSPKPSQNGNGSFGLQVRKNLSKIEELN